MLIHCQSGKGTIDYSGICVALFHMNMNKSLPAEQLLVLLEAAIRDAPAFVYQEPLTESDIRWLGRVDALLEASGSMPALIGFRTARAGLGSFNHDRTKLLIPLHDAYSKIELRVPSALQGAFIPAGDTWNGYAAIVKLIQRDCEDLFIVDPYLDLGLYTDFAPLAAASKGMRALTSRQSANHPGLSTISAKWAGDSISNGRAVEVRYAPKGTLHDRLIIIDGTEVWLVSQSLKDIAKRSAASVSRADPELASMKAQHYSDLWSQSEPLT